MKILNSTDHTSVGVILAHSKQFFYVENPKKLKFEIPNYNSSDKLNHTHLFFQSFDITQYYHLSIPICSTALINRRPFPIGPSQIISAKNESVTITAPWPTLYRSDTLQTSMSFAKANQRITSNFTHKLSICLIGMFAHNRK